MEGYGQRTEGDSSDDGERAGAVARMRRFRPTARSSDPDPLPSTILCSMSRPYVQDVDTGISARGRRQNDRRGRPLHAPHVVRVHEDAVVSVFRANTDT